MRFNILGPIRVEVDGCDDVVITASRERTLLAVLLLHANESVPVDRLIDAIWGARVPSTARNQLQRCVHQLRRRLSDAGIDGEVIVTEPAAYRAAVGPGCLDLFEFRRLLVAARAAVRADRPDDAVVAYRHALGHWRGPALVDVDSDPVRHAAAVLDEERAVALEERFEAELANGAAAELTAELTELVRQYPYREGLYGALMRALYRAGRQADALAAYQRARRLLHDDLGTEPGAGLQRLHHAILAQDAGLDAVRSPHLLATQPPPRELPAQVAGFTGRDEVLRALEELLPDGDNPTAPVVISAISGSGGVGKTALAVHWGHRVAHRFPDGQLYLNLRGYAAQAPLRPIDALSALLRSLGVPPDQVPADEAEAGARYRSVLAGRRVLVLLDNARSAEQVRPLLPGAAGCMALVTSRDRLAGLVARDGARRLTLDVLTPGEAYELLARLLGADRVAAEPESTRELAKACAYLPLALRIAAALVDEDGDRGIGELVEELVSERRLAVLTVPDDEQTAVRAAFDLSYHAIPEPARRLFRLLGLVPGQDVSRAAAVAMADLPEDATRRNLERLLAAHLVTEHTSGRYTFHDLLRDYARERARQDETEVECAGALTRLFAWYLGTIDPASRTIRPDETRLPLSPDQAGPTQPPLASRREAIAVLEAERAGLVAAIQHAAENGPRPYAWLLADRMRPYFRLRLGLDWLTVGEAAVAAATAEGSTRDQAAAHLALADAHLFLMTDRQLATTHYAAASRLAAQADWLHGQATAENNVALASIDSGRLHEAAARLNAALALNRKAGRRSHQAYNISNLGLVHCELGELGKARDFWEQGLAMHRSNGNVVGQAISHANVGRAYWLLGRLDVALKHLEEALRLNQETGNQSGEVHVLRVLAEVHSDAGRHEEALRCAKTALSFARTGSPGEEGFVMNAVAFVYHNLGRYRQAARHFQLALGADREQHYQRTEALVGLTATLAALGQNQPAHDRALEALTAARNNQYKVLEGQALTAFAQVALGQGNLDEAESLALQAVEKHRRTQHSLGEARAMILLGRIRQTAGDTPAAQRDWTAATELFIDCGAPPPVDVDQK